MPMRHGHAEALAPMVERVMGEVDGGFASLGAIAATIGPGSFTGIRIGLAMARAIGVALDMPVIGVSTLVAFAAPLLAEPGRASSSRRSTPATATSIHQSYEASGRPLFAPRVGAPPRRSAPSAPARRGSSATRPRLLAAEARRAGLPSRPIRPPIPTSSRVARIGLAADPAASPPRPLYVKPPDAKPAAAKRSPAARIERSGAMRFGFRLPFRRPRPSTIRPLRVEAAEACAAIHGRLRPSLVGGRIRQPARRADDVGSAALDPPPAACAASRCRGSPPTKRRS